MESRFEVWRANLSRRADLMLGGVIEGLEGRFLGLEVGFEAGGG